MDKKYRWLCYGAAQISVTISFIALALKNLTAYKISATLATGFLICGAVGLFLAVLRHLRQHD